MRLSSSRRWIAGGARSGRIWLHGLVVLIAMATLPVMAHDANAPPPFPGWHDIKCACRANGRSYELGQHVCLKTPSGYRVAECRMSQNVMSCAMQTDSCDVSAGLPRSPAATES